MCVVVFGNKEKNHSIRVTKDMEKVKRAKEIIFQVAKEGGKIVEQIEEVHMIGNFVEEGNTSGIKFMTQITAGHALL